MSDKDAKGIDSLADLLKRGPEPAAAVRRCRTPPRRSRPRPQRRGRAAPSRLEVEVIDLEAEDVVEVEPAVRDEPEPEEAEADDRRTVARPRRSS